MRTLTQSTKKLQQTNNHDINIDILKLLKKLPDDLKTLIYREHFEKEIEADKYYGRILRLFNCSNTERMILNRRLAQFVEISLKNSFLTKRLIENPNTSHFAKIKSIYDNNVKNNIEMKEHNYFVFTYIWFIIRMSK